MSVAPDEGMMLLAQRLHRRQVVAAAATQPDDHDTQSGGVTPAAPAEAGGGGLELGVALGAFTRATAAMESGARSLARMAATSWSHVHPIEPPGAQQAGAGVIDRTDQWGPMEGWAWRIFAINVTLAAGATSWSAALISANDPTNIIVGPSTSSALWEPSHRYLLPGNRLVFSSAGGGLTVSKWAAAEISLDFLPFYMGLK